MARSIFTKALAAALLVSMARGQSQDFDVDMTSECEAWDDTTGMCKRWRISGKVDQDAVACFSGDSVVLTPAGHVKMSALRAGDTVLGSHGGTDQFLEVGGWIHRVEGITASMLRVQTACNTTLEVSKEHMVAVNSRTTFARASTVQAGDTMFGAGGNKCTVVHVAQVALTSGVYAPYVREGEIYVDGLLAHVLAFVPYPTLVMPFFNALMDLCPYMYQDWCVAQTSSYLHPLGMLGAKLIGVSPALADGADLLASGTSAPSHASDLFFSAASLL